MKQTLVFNCLLLLVISFNWGCDRQEVRKEVRIEKMIDPEALPGMIHTVYFWLNEDLSKNQRQEFADAVELLEGIPSVKRMFVGPPAPTPAREVVDASYDYALIVWFDDVAGHEAYQVHEIHQEFVDSQEEKFASVRVYDNVLGPIN